MLCNNSTTQQQNDSYLSITSSDAGIPIGKHTHDRGDVQGIAPGNAHIPAAMADATAAYTSATRTGITPMMN